MKRTPARALHSNYKNENRWIVTEITIIDIFKWKVLKGNLRRLSVKYEKAQFQMGNFR